MRSVRALALWLNVAVPGVLVSLAYATPPDPTYLGGFWDNADYDDVVILVTSSTGSTESHPESDPPCELVVVAPVLPGEEERPAPPLPPRSSPRAPPVV
jgi:hypothetical protein